LDRSRAETPIHAERGRAGPYGRLSSFYPGNEPVACAGIPEELSTRLIDWSSFVIIGNTMPPLDPDGDEEAEEEEEDDEEDRADEPLVLREPDED
jgi:hypothetical protein